MPGNKLVAPRWLLLNYMRSPVLPAALQFLDGETLTSVMTLNKIVRKAIREERHIYTVDNPRFIHGDGMKTLV